MAGNRLCARLSIGVAVLLAAACSGGGSGGGGDPDGSASVGPLGGTVSLRDGPSLDVPSGALDAARTLTIARSDAAAPSGAVTPLYAFGPEGTSFSSPATVTFTLPAGTTTGQVYWTKAGSTTDFEPLPTTVTGSVVTAQVTHFSLGYVGPAAPPRTRTVAGAFRISYAGATPAPSAQPEGTQVWALVPDGSAGYTSYPGTLNPDGTFTIPGVPEGSYFLSVKSARGSYAYEHRGDAPTLTEYLPRPAGLRVPTQSTQLTFDVTGLDSWDGNPAIGMHDLFEVANAELDLWLPSWKTVNSSPDRAATSASFTFELADPNMPAPIPAPAATLYASQSSRGALESGVVFRRATRYAAVSGTSLAEGGAARVSVPLQPVPQTDSLRASASGWKAIAAEINPGAVGGGHVGYTDGLGMNVFRSPEPRDYPLRGPAVLREVYVQFPQVDSVDAGELSFGQLPAPGWRQEVQLLAQYHVAVPLPGGGSHPVDWLDVSSRFARSSLPAGPVTPLLHPVRGPRIGGRDAFQAQSGVGLQPEIAWSAPSKGTPTRYTVAVEDVTAPETPSFAATVRSATRFVIPPGVLTAGHIHVASITSHQGDGWDSLDADDWAWGIPSSSAVCVTAGFTP